MCFVVGVELSVVAVEVNCVHTACLAVGDVHDDHVTLVSGVEVPHREGSIVHFMEESTVV